MAKAGNLTGRDVKDTFESWCVDKTGLGPSDHGYFPAAVFEQYLAARAIDILETLTKEATDINKSTQQTLGCLALEEVPVEDCPCAPPSGCTWRRTELPTPAVIGQILAVTAIGGNLELLQHFTYRDWDKVKFSLQSRIKAERTRGYYCIRNNYIYVVTPLPLKAIAVSAIFYDPVETQRYPQCGKPAEVCEPFLDYPLYIDPAKHQKLIATTFQVIAGLRGDAPLDTTNNAQPAVVPEPPRPY